MGLLDILNGMQNGPRGPSAPSKGSDKGGMSPITMAILALLAYKAMKHMTGGQAADRARGRRPRQPRSGLAAGRRRWRPRRYSRQRARRRQCRRAAERRGGGLGDLLKGGLGGLLAGGAAGSVLGGGLNDLLKQLQDGGQKEAADSWVSKGPNKEIAPNDLAGALGADQINMMMQQSGLSKQELLDGLSQYLPGVIDQLTPDGRMPSADELRRLL